MSAPAPAAPEFRPQPADAPAARSLLDAYLAELRARLGEFDESRAAPASAGEMAPPGDAFLVGYIDGRPVACGGLRSVDRGGAEVKRMWVAPGVRRRGVGRRLLAALELAAHAAGHDRLVLDTSAEQPEALALYRAAGYREVADYNGNPYAAHWFEKAL